MRILITSTGSLVFACIRHHCRSKPTTGGPFTYPRGPLTTTTIQTIISQASNASPSLGNAVLLIVIGAAIGGLIGLGSSYLFWHLKRKDDEEARQEDRENEQQRRRNDRVQETRLHLSSITTELLVLEVHVDYDFDIKSETHPKHGTRVYSHRWRLVSEWEDHLQGIYRELNDIRNVHIRDEDYPEGQSDQLRTLLEDVGDGAKKVMNQAVKCSYAPTENDDIRNLAKQKALLKDKLDDLEQTVFHLR